MKLCLSCQHSYSSSSWQCPTCGLNPLSIDGYLNFAPELAERNSGFPEESFSRLYRLEAGNFWFVNRNELIIWAINHYFPQARNFLEIGCGTGFVLRGIGDSNQGLKLYGSEIYRQGLSFAASRVPRATLFQMDARNIPYVNEFDVVGAFDVIEHIDEDTEVLKQIFKASVNPGGGLLLTVPQHKFLWSTTDDYAKHVRRYEKAELMQKVENAGYKVLKVTSFVSILMPFLVISRLLCNQRADNYDPESEFKLPPVINDALQKLLLPERIAIKLGASLPWGGSLLLVAQRA